MTQVSVRYATRQPWAPAAVTLRRWIARAAGRARGELGVRVVDAREGRKLNRQWRGKDYATNVLSFPIGDNADSALLGDLVICAPLMAREAQQQGKDLKAHWAHIVVHGVLHLLGYDHQRAADARVMENRERELLGAMGYPDPYAN